jgi:cellulose synthase/poly-beta-1,6-N-acetylglucosamine synthase-like glycosyltransferase
MELSQTKLNVIANGRFRRHLKRVALYFPTRYLLCAFFFAYLLFVNMEFIRSSEAKILANMLHFLGFPSLYFKGSLYFGEALAVSQIQPPVLSQILFLIFFPVFAVTSRINFKMRLKFLSYGLLCFFAFIVIQFITVLSINAFAGIVNVEYFRIISIFVTMIVGGLFIELSLFSTLTKPHPVKEVKPAIKRRYMKEYLYMVIVLFASSILVFLLLNSLQIGLESPIAPLGILVVNIAAMLAFVYAVSLVLYETKPPDWLRWVGPNVKGDNSASFLIAAYNEEVLIGGVIESIDKASAHYNAGKTEIIIVNDGSTDNTAGVIAEAFKKLRYSTGKIFSIANSGKGAALAYGLEKTSGEIIFRIDADTTIDEYAIEPIMNHFKDPEVGSVSGMFVPLNLKNPWQKCINLLNFIFTFNKRAQSLIDSIIVQPGAFSVFRKDALVKIGGGWATNQFGEDGEITHRLSRFGYRAAIEPRSIAHVDVQPTLIDILHQRARWAVAFYHSRGRHLDVIKEVQRPRWIAFLANLLEHGISFAGSLAIPFLAAAILSGALNFSASSIPFVFLSKLAIIQLLVYIIQASLISYNLIKFKRFGYIKYFPLMKILMFFLMVLIKPQVTEALLAWSCKWNRYSNDAFKDLRKEVRRSVDPKY